MEVCSKKTVFLAVLITALTVMYRRVPRQYILTSYDSYQKWTLRRGITVLDRVWDNTNVTRHQEQPIAPCSFRRMERNHTGLWQKFNFSVPVFQWNQSYSQEEYKRLSSRPLPYGWKGLPEDVIKSTLALLNTSSSGRLVEPQYRDQCLRCAVVGNGGILRGSGQGRDIDSHDLVFRTNGAVTQGFEEDVGKRTSFYGFTTNTMKNSLAAYWRVGFRRVPQGPETRYIFFPTSIRDFVLVSSALRGQTVPSGRDVRDRPSKYFGRIQRDHFKMLHPDFIYYVTQSFLKSKLLSGRYKNIYRPTTGALLLMTALHTCDQISAYGYITKNFANFSDHYFDSVKKRLVFYANHDMRMEKVLWEEFDRQSVMHLYQRSVAAA